MISHKHKCIFVHIPKTAGTSIEQVIWKEDERIPENLCHGSKINKYQTGGLQHLTASQIRTEIGEDIFSQYYKFTVVRNPWDKAVSQYMYTKHKRKDLRRKIGMNEATTFKEYLSLILKKRHVQWKKQTAFVYDSNKKLLVDKVIFFENLKEDIRLIFNQLKINHLPLPHTNKSIGRLHYSNYYDNESIKIIADFYQEDIEKFKYSFEN